MDAITTTHVRKRKIKSIRIKIEKGKRKKKRKKERRRRRKKKKKEERRKKKKKMMLMMMTKNIDKEIDCQGKDIKTECLLCSAARI